MNKRPAILAITGVVAALPLALPDRPEASSAQAVPGVRSGTASEGDRRPAKDQEAAKREIARVVVSQHFSFASDK